MRKLLACRACLATDVKLYCMCTTRLKKAYENVTDTKVTRAQKYPQYLCSYCAILVIKYAAFKDKCERAKELLNITILQYNKITTKHIKNLDRKSSKLTLPLKIHRIDINSETNIVEDESCLQDDSIQPPEKDLIQEIVDDMKEICSFTTDLDNTDRLEMLYSSSDEEPLSVKVKKKEDIDEEQKQQGENNKEEELKDIEVVVLTTEQQIEEIEVRKSSVNYRNSIFKCEMCFKGFITDDTYKNHMIKHDPSSGPHACAVCQTRWPTLRSLRAHIGISHEKKFLCKICNYVSRSLYRAKEHSLWHSGYMFRCKACGATFSKSTSYLTHVRMQHPSKHCCDMCGESFIGENGLKIHKKKAHKDPQKWKKEHKCTLCDVQFHNMDAFKMHSSMSDPASGCDTTVKPCPECGHSFLSDESVREHMKTHRKNIVKCNDCNRTFAHKRSIAIHYQRVHMGLKMQRPVSDRNKKMPSVCEICGCKCLSKASLVHHQRIHTGEKPFQCPSCPNKFSVYQGLQVHLRTHTGERPFKCTQCTKAFKHKAALNRHNRVHTGAKPYECPHCNKTFSQSNSMKIHVNTVHLRMPPPYKKDKKLDPKEKLADADP